MPIRSSALPEQELEKEGVVIEQVSLNVAGGERIGMCDGRVPLAGAADLDLDALALQFDARDVSFD